MSDLHCPARVYVVVPGGRDVAGEDGPLAGPASSERVARVLVDHDDGEGTRLARLLGVPLEERPGLAGLEVGEDRPVAPVLDDVADDFPGEAVLVVAARPGPGTWLLVREAGAWTVRPLVSAPWNEG